jgi:hypothetical protein
MPKNSYIHFGTVGYDLGSVVIFFLKALKEIFKEGIITEEEYKIKRQSLVDKL